MASSNPWCETPTHDIYVPPDTKSLNNRINFLIGTVKKKAQEINNTIYEIEKIHQELLQNLNTGDLLIR